MKFGDLMPHADIPPYAEYLEAWEKEHKPVYPKLDPCMHGSTVITKKTDIAGRTHYRVRCTECARMVKPLKKVDAIKLLQATMPPDDDELTDSIRASPSNERNFQKEQLHVEYVRLYKEYVRARFDDWRDYHRRYMESAQWKKLRAAVLERDNNECQACGSTETLQCHHNTYERLGAENMSDLVTLCTRCHTNHHIELDMERERERIWQENQLKINQQLLG